MPVITIASSKGGVGKTVCAQILAASLAPAVATIDADPNRTLYDWSREVYEGEPFLCRAESDAGRLVNLLHELAEAVPLLIVDTAGFGNQAATAAMAGLSHLDLDRLRSGCCLTPLHVYRDESRVKFAS